MEIRKDDMFKLKKIVLKKGDNILGMIYDLENYFTPTACVYTVSGESIDIHIPKIEKITSTRVSKETRCLFDNLGKTLKNIDKLNNEKEDFIKKYEKTIGLENDSVLDDLNSLKNLYTKNTGLITRRDFEDIIENSLMPFLRELEGYCDYNDIFFGNNAIDISISVESIKYPDVGNDFNGMLYLEYDNTIHSSYTEKGLADYVQRKSKSYQGPELSTIIKRTKDKSRLLKYSITPFLSVGDKTVAAGFSMVADLNDKKIEFTKDNALAISQEIKSMLTK